MLRIPPWPIQQLTLEGTYDPGTMNPVDNLPALLFRFILSHPFIRLLLFFIFFLPVSILTSLPSSSSFSLIPSSDPLLSLPLVLSDISESCHQTGLMPFLHWLKQVACWEFHLSFLRWTIDTRSTRACVSQYLLLYLFLSTVFILGTAPKTQEYADYCMVVNTLQFLLCLFVRIFLGEIYNLRALKKNSWEMMDSPQISQTSA